MERYTVVFLALLPFTAAAGSTLSMASMDQPGPLETAAPLIKIGPSSTLPLANIFEKPTAWLPLVEMDGIAPASFPIWRVVGIIILVGLVAKLWRPLLRANEEYWANEVYDY